MSLPAIARADATPNAASLRVRAVEGAIEIVRADELPGEVVGRLALPGPIHDVVRVGNVVYIARGRIGVTSVDVSQPRAPREIATFGGGERPVVRLALAGDTLLVIVAEFATRP